MTPFLDRALAASAPAIWGSSYIVATEFLPADYPLTVSALRALPAGLLLMALVRQLPPRALLWRIVVLGAPNFALFWSMLFYAAYNLPGGVAATLGAVQPLIVLVLSKFALGAPIERAGVIAAVAGVGGVALLVLGPAAELDPIGVLAALAGAASMASGVVLTRKWAPSVTPLAFTAWQLTAGGVLLAPLALVFEPPLPPVTGDFLIGMAWLSLVGAALTFFFWVRGIVRLGPQSVIVFGFLSPLSAVLLGWLFLGETLSPAQSVGALFVIASISLGQASPTVSKCSSMKRRSA